MYKDRKEAGKLLAARLESYKEQKDVVVLGLARGGVITAYEVAQALHLPLNVLVVRKIGAPGNEELALGAITESGEGLFNESLIALLGVSKDYLKQEIAKQKKIAQERIALYHGSIPTYPVKGKVVILVDDGIATGASIRVAIKALRELKAQKIIVAVPVAAPDSLKKLEKEVEEIVCLESPYHFAAVGSFYKVFDQTSDEEIIHLFSKS